MVCRMCLMVDMKGGLIVGLIDVCVVRYVDWFVNGISVALVEGLVDGLVDGMGGWIGCWSD